MVIHQRVVERAAVSIDGLLARAAQLSCAQRQAVYRGLVMASPVFADWLQWTFWFPLLFSVGVLSQFAALLAISFQSAPIVAYVLVLVGMVSLAVGAIRLWRVSLMALDAAVGACAQPAPRREGTYA
jgi:hypothetical protein